MDVQPLPPQSREDEGEKQRPEVTGYNHGTTVESILGRVGLYELRAEPEDHSLPRATRPDRDNRYRREYLASFL